MKSAGYDLLVQVDERLLNRGLAAVFYTGKLKAVGTYAFVQGVPASLTGFTEVSYRIRLRNEPFIDFRRNGTTALRLSVEIVLRVLTGVDIEMDVDFGATAVINFDLTNQQITYDLTNSEIFDIVLNDRLKFHKNTLDRINHILKIVLKQYLTDDIKKIAVPIDLLQMDVQVPVGESNTILLPARWVDVGILDQRLLAVGVNFFDHSGGSLSGVKDMTEGAELFAALRVDFLQKLIKLWWEHSGERTESFNGSLPVSPSRIARGADLLTRGLSLGFLESETEVKNLKFIYDGMVQLVDQPKVSFHSGNIVQIENARLKVMVKGHLEGEVHKKLKLDTSGFIPDHLTPWNDDRQLSEKTQNSSWLDLSEEITLELKNIECCIEIDKQNRLVVKAMAGDLELDLGNNWIENLGDRFINSFLDLLEKTIISKLPPIPISPSLLLSNASIEGYTFNLGLQSIEMQNDELVITTGLGINELANASVPVPLYIGNRKSAKLHRFDCPVVEGIDFSHRIGYYDVYEAMKDGLKPCGECLRGYSPLEV